MSSCAVPSNQPIYEALIKKANSYPTDKPYQAKACKKAAETILSSKIDIYKLVKQCNNMWDWQDDFEDDFPTIGSGISNFIFNYVNDNPLPTVTPQNVPPTQCKVANNQPIYEALVKKANSYPADKVYQAKAYKKVAEGVLNFDQDIYANSDKIWLIKGVGDSIEGFIEDFIKANPLTNSKEEPGFCIKVNPDYKGISVCYKTKQDLIPFMKELITNSGLTPSDLFDAVPAPAAETDSISLKVCFLRDNSQGITNCCYINPADAAKLAKISGKPFDRSSKLMCSLSNASTTYVYNLCICDDIPAGSIGMNLLQRVSTNYIVDKSIVVAPHTFNNKDIASTMTIKVDLLTKGCVITGADIKRITDHIKQYYVGQMFYPLSMFCAYIDNYMCRVIVVDIKTVSGGTEYGLLDNPTELTVLIS